MSQARPEVSSEPVVVTARFVVRPGAADAFREAGVEVTRATAAEPGCIAYVLHEDAERPSDFVFYERWRSEQDLEAHLATAHVRQFLDAVEPLLERDIEVRRWQMILTP